MRKIWIIIGALLLMLIYMRHISLPDYDWKCELFADQSGYYVYLPATFIYHFSGSDLPVNIVEKTGLGFKIDSTGKIITKYTYGIALLQLPIFLFIHALAHISHLPTDGFSHLYQEIPNIAVWLYTMLAFLISLKLLQNYFSRKISIIALYVVFLGTNWYYYVVDSTGMSHAYSAFLIAWLFFLIKRMADNRDFIRVLTFLQIFFILGLITVIRPTNVLVFPIIMYISFSKVHFKNSLQKFISKILLRRTILVKLFGSAFVSFFIAWLPQLLYWKYTFNSYLTYSYGDEGFIYKYNPQFFHLWFSPDNGLFLYNPLYIVIVLIMIYLTINHNRIVRSLLFLFFILSYVFSSWHAVSYGCSYGQRNYVDFSIFWCLPIGFALEYFNKFQTKLKLILLSLAFICIVFNQFLIYNYNKCFFSSAWDYTEYFYYFSKHWYKEEHWFNDELEVNSGNDFAKAFEYRKQSKIYKLKFCRLNFDVLNIGMGSKIFARHELLKKGEIIHSSEYPINLQPLDSAKWIPVEFTCEFPKSEHWESAYRFVFINPDKNVHLKIKKFQVFYY